MSAAKKGVGPKLTAEQAELQQQATAIISRDQLEKLKQAPSTDDGPMDLDFDVMGSDNVDNLPDMSVLNSKESESSEDATKTVKTKSSELSLEALDEISELEDSTSNSALSAVKLEDLPSLDLEMETSSSANDQAVSSEAAQGLDDGDKFTLDLTGMDNQDGELAIEGTKRDKTETGEVLESDAKSSDIQLDDLGDLAFDAGPAPDLSSPPEAVPVKGQSASTKGPQDEYLTASAELDFGIEDENLAPTKLIDLAGLNNQELHSVQSAQTELQDNSELTESMQNSSENQELEHQTDIEFNSKEGTNTKLKNQIAEEVSKRVSSQMGKQSSKRGEPLFNNSDSSVSGLRPELGSLIAQAKEDLSFKAYYEEEMLKLKSLVQGLREDRGRMIKEMEDLKERNLKLEQSNLGNRADYEDKIIEIEVIKKRYQKDLEDMRLTLELNLQKKEMAEARLRSRQADLDAMAKKLKIDFQKVQEREKHLEGQLELLRSDSASQILSRDNKILELKRKIDTLEFDLEAMSEEEKKMKQDRVYTQEKMDGAMRAIRKALQLLEDSPDVGSDPVIIENHFFKRQSKG